MPGELNQNMLNVDWRAWNRSTTPAQGGELRQQAH